MAISRLIRTREDTEKLPESWHTSIEKAKEKARKFKGQVIAIDQSTSVVVGKLTEVEIDKLKYPYCRLGVSKARRYRQSGDATKMGEQELFFINKPQMVMDMKELSQRFPKIYEEVLGKIKTDAFG